MARGGKRPGAGRKRGSKNQKVIEREKAAAAAAASGMTPLQYVIDVMRNSKTTIKRRDWAAATALPFTHPRLQSIAGDPDKPLIHEHRMDDLSLARAVAFLLYRAMHPEKGRTLEQATPKKVAAE